MHVQSKPGYGTIRTIFLPAVDTPNIEPNLATEVLLAPILPAKTAKPSTLLVWTTRAACAQLRPACSSALVIAC
jgi:hypothetical protein